MIYLFFSFRELFHNNIEHLPPNTFDGLSALQYLRIERNAINCDCSIHDVVKRFDQNRTRIHIVCDKPSHSHGQNFNNLNEKDLNCGEYNLNCANEKFKFF